MPETIRHESPLLNRVSLPLFDQVLRFLSITLAAGAIARIVQQRLLAPPLTSLFWMLAAVLVRDAIVSIPRYDSHAYTLAWEYTLPVLLGAQLWAGLDTLLVIAQLYPNFGRFILRLYVFCLAISVAVCCLILPFETRRLLGGETVLRLFFLLQRCTDGCIAVTLMLASIFLAWFPAPSKKPPRNLVLHTVLLTTYFGGYALLFMTENLAPLGGAAVIERAQFVLVILVYAVWAAGLSKEGARSDPWPEIDVVVMRAVDASTSVCGVEPACGTAMPGHEAAHGGGGGF